MWPFNTGDCLIEVTLDRAVLTIYLCENESLGWDSALFSQNSVKF